MIINTIKKRKTKMIEYLNNVKNINPENLKGFFVGWPEYPSPEKHLKLLQNSDYVVVAVDSDSRQVIGFINAISDKVLSAYIPLLEVLPDYKGKGIGQELVKRIFEQLKDFYMIDICCDEEVVKFYEKFEMHQVKGMIKRNYNMQSGK